MPRTDWKEYTRKRKERKARKDELWHKKHDSKIDRSNTDQAYWNEILSNQGLGVTRVEKQK